MESSAVITVVVPTRNRGALIYETIHAILNSDYPNFQVVVVDQSTDAATYDAVQEAASGDQRVRVERSNTVGAAVARNIGAQATPADIVAFTDDDCIVSRDWLKAIAAEFEDPGVSAVYGQLLPFESETRTGREVGLRDAPRRVEFTKPVPPWYIGTGGNMSFRRAALLEVGGFDAALGAGGLFGAGEDIDVAYRLLTAGKRVVYSPKPLAFHKHWKTWQEQQKMERAYGVGLGAQLTKYIRCGDSYGVKLLSLWIWQMGVRRVGSGLLKWRSRKTMYLGYCELIYPWLGVAKSLRHPIDRGTGTYAPN